jgi:predicted NAD/FAD-binding protein
MTKSAFRIVFFCKKNVTRMTNEHNNIYRSFTRLVKQINAERALAFLSITFYHENALNFPAAYPNLQLLTQRRQLVCNHQVQQQFATITHFLTPPSFDKWRRVESHVSIHDNNLTAEHMN